MKLNQIGANQTTVTIGKEKVIFYSYNTPVACFIGDGSTVGYFRTSKKWSVTTSKHINKWLDGIRAEEKEQEFFDNLVK
jgi:hypothetical protein